MRFEIQCRNEVLDWYSNLATMHGLQYIKSLDKMIQQNGSEVERWLAWPVKCAEALSHLIYSEVYLIFQSQIKVCFLNMLKTAVHRTTHWCNMHHQTFLSQLPATSYLSIFPQNTAVSQSSCQVTRVWGTIVRWNPSFLDRRLNSLMRGTIYELFHRYRSKAICR